MKRLLSLILVSSVLFISCEDDQISFQEETEEFKGLQIIYGPEVLEPELTIVELNSVFKKMAASLSKISIDPEARNLLYTEIERRFDGDNNVLLKTLFQRGVEENQQALLAIKEEMLNDINIFKNITVNNFTIIDKLTGKKYYPQLFIPSYKRRPLVGENPVLVLHDGEDASDYIDGKVQLKGFLAKENGLERLDFLIDEQYTMENEVWVISINEKVDENGEFVKENIETIESLSNARTLSTFNAVINKITIRDSNESWPSGNSEITIRLWSDFYLAPGATRTQGPWWVNSSSGVQIWSMPGSSLNVEHVLDYTYYPGWDPTGGNPTGAKGDILFYSIYESDSWPTGNKSVSVSPPNPACPYICVSGQALSWTYRSADVAYDVGTVFYDSPSYPIFDPDTRVIDISGQIKWNSTTN